ncbi:hypothetical protein BQ8482_310029 [Mesorhizobium delmotii]|uniref:Uncharacterized protein n=1 Tax=Mesorhizobium delmotii TaxID=1631247 RepID=A0A2P9ANH4_9HYPH|nr:hypothetical protein BQ8482_310029 [Mesorhizobium delmotii]
MSEQAETGHVGHRMDTLILRELRSDPVEQGGRGDHLDIGAGRERLLLDGGAVDADAECLRQDQGVSRPRARIAPDVIGPACTDHGKTIDRLRRVDRVAPGDRDSGGGANCPSALQNVSDHMRRHLVERHTENGQRHDWPAAHRIDVGDRVGRGDPAEIIRIVNHGHEKIGGGDDTGVVVKLPHSGVVAGLGADKKLTKGIGLDLVCEKLLKDGGRQLATAAAAMGETGQAKHWNVGDFRREGDCHGKPP